MADWLKIALIAAGILASMGFMMIPGRNTNGRPWWIPEPKIPEARLHINAGADVARVLHGLYPNESPAKLWERAHVADDEMSEKQLNSVKVGFFSYFAADDYGW